MTSSVAAAQFLGADLAANFLLKILITVQNQYKFAGHFYSLFIDEQCRILWLIGREILMTYNNNLVALVAKS